MIIPSYDVIIDIETNGFRRAGMAVHCIEAIVVQTGEQSRGRSAGLHADHRHEVLIETARRVIGHNMVVFDIPSLQRVLGIMVPTDKVIDTLIASRVDRGSPRVDALDPTMPAKLRSAQPR